MIGGAHPYKLAKSRPILGAVLNSITLDDKCIVHQARGPRRKAKDPGGQGQPGTRKSGDFPSMLYPPGYETVIVRLVPGLASSSSAPSGHVTCTESMSPFGPSP
jgi:hypothetical protein